MKLKIKKGSSMISVLMVFAILVTLGAAMLSLTTADFQIRVKESKKIQNLYYSDSGLNITYGIIRKAVEVAIKAGNVRAEAFMTAFNADPRIDMSLYTGNSVDKMKFKERLSREFREGYKQYINSFVNAPSDDNGILKGFYLEDDGITRVNVDYNLPIPPEISFHNAAAPAFAVDGSGRERMILTVRSAFYSTTLNPGEQANKKQVQVNYLIEVPEYNNPYFLQTKAVTIDVNMVWKKAIAIDGNMFINSDLSVNNGDVYVKGNMDAISEDIKTYSKYRGGIMIGQDESTNPINVVFGNSVVTPLSFNITGTGKLVRAGNIYSGNVYMGKGRSTSHTNSSACRLDVLEDGDSSRGSVFTNNDLAFNALNSHVNIDKYYGINEITNPAASNLEAKSSSSIIVNTNDIGAGGSSITVNKDAIIMGTAYINTAIPYQTGESVAIKGNYRAYNNPLPVSTEAVLSAEEAEWLSKYNQGNVIFDFIDPLQLATALRDESRDLNLFDKGKYIKLFDKIFNGSGLKKNGVSLPGTNASTGEGTVSVGSAAVNNGIALKTYNDTDIVQRQKIQNKQIEYASQAFEMGAAASLGVYSKDNINRAVFQGDLNKVLGSDGLQKNTVRQVTLSGAHQNKTNSKINDYREVILYRTAADVVIIGQNPAGYVPQGDTADNIEVDLRDVVNSQGIIVTSGNVKVYGTLNFKGTIIAGGDFITGDNRTKIFNYDDNYVQRIIAEHYDAFKEIFNPNTAVGKQTVELSASANTGDTVSTGGYIIDNEIVKFDRWRIIPN